VIVFSISIHSFINLEKIFYLAWSVIIAGIFQVIILFYSINSDFWKVFFKVDTKKTKIKEFFSLYWPTFISSSLFQANLIIGMLICSTETGAVTYLYYSERLFFLPLTLIGVALGIVLIPNLSDYLRNNNRHLAIEHTKKASHYLFCTILPLTSLLIVLSPQIVAFLFERGEFTFESTKNTSLVFSFFLLGLPAATFVKILNPYFFAIEKPKIPLVASLKSNLLNLVLMLTLFKYMGFIGIPLALSISTWILVIFLYIEHKKRDFFLIDLDIKKQILKYSLFSIFLLISGMVIKNTILLTSVSNFFQIALISFLFFSFYIIFVFFLDKKLMDKFILLLNKIIKKDSL
jgi:putative peptidoglycan lipid II flippase